MTNEQQDQVEDIVRLIPAEERAAFLEMLAHELRGRELTAGERNPDLLCERALEELRGHLYGD